MLDNFNKFEAVMYIIITIIASVIIIILFLVATEPSWLEVATVEIKEGWHRNYCDTHKPIPNSNYTRRLIVVIERQEGTSLLRAYRYYYDDKSTKTSLDPSLAFEIIKKNNGIIASNLKV